MRLPSLLAKIKRASLVVEAGAELSGSAKTAIEGAAKAAGSGNARIAIGLACAVKQVGAVGTAVADGSTKLQGSLSAATDVTGALGLK